MKVLIVGGDFGIKKESGVIRKLSERFTDSTTINGGELSDLPKELNSDLILWMPNISNEEQKHYPRKSTGNVLICSKVMREGYKKIDAVSRIFKMQGNAVIAIHKEDNRFIFNLIDALGNSWYCGDSIETLVDSIDDFYNFTISAVRIKSNRSSLDNPPVDSLTYQFIEINKNLSEYIQTSCGERFFGNLSTRCQKLFPSMRSNGMLVSPRNVDKSSLTADDMVYCYKENDELYYTGGRKPSVDAPIQIEIYNKCPNVNYMIHGHAFIKGAKFTSTYYLCGDLRESEEVIKIIGDNNFGFINLKNHGFLIYADSLSTLTQIIKKSEFYYNVD